MKILTYTLGPLQTNCYLLIHEKDCLIVDPVDSADFLLEEVLRRGLTITALISTHGHFDHIMAVGEMQIALGNSQKFPLYIHPKDRFLVTRLGETARYFLGYEPEVLPVQEMMDLPVGDFSLGAFSFQVLHTPGHTPGGCCFFFPAERILLSGDTLFKGSVGRYDFSYSDVSALKQSLIQLLELPPDTTVYPGHGEKTLIGEEGGIGDSF